MHHYSPLRYPGGKNSIFQFMASIIRENHLYGIDYAEPFAGGAGLALRLLAEGYVGRIFINDLDHAIYCFWKSLINNNKEMCRWLEHVDVSVPSWKKYKSIHLNQSEYTELEIAKATFFLNRTNVSGVIKGGIIGGFDQQGKYKIDARFNRGDLLKKFRKVGELSKRINLSCLDVLDFIKEASKKSSDLFVYLDPPYVQKASQLYMNFFEEDDHRILSKQILKMKSRFIVSYDKSELILRLYDDLRMMTYSLQHSTSNKIGDEVVIISDNLSYKNSKGFLANSNELGI